MVGTLWKADQLPLETKKVIYQSLVESHLNYGILMWGSSFCRNILGTYDIDHVPGDLKYLNTSINKVMRAIFRKRRYDKKNKINTPSSPLYKELGVLKLCDLYYYNLAMLVHEFYYGNTLPTKLADKYTKKEDVTNVRTRNNDLELYYPLPNHVKTYKKPTIASAAFWNTLPRDIKIIKSKTGFKNKLKEYLLSRY